MKVEKRNKYTHKKSYADWIIIGIFVGMALLLAMGVVSCSLSGADDTNDKKNTGSDNVAAVESYEPIPSQLMKNPEEVKEESENSVSKDTATEKNKKAALGRISVNPATKSAVAKNSRSSHRKTSIQPKRFGKKIDKKRR